MSDDEITEFIERSRTATMATVLPSGRPHLVAMWYAVLDGEVWFETKAKSQKAVNLRRDPTITVMIEDGQTYNSLRGVSIDGRALQALQRASEKKVVTAQMWVAQLYARGRGVAVDTERAEQLFNTLQAALPPDWTNEFAWELAIAPDARRRDAGRAIALMKTLLANPKEATARHLDTLAAAYAASGQFTDAVTTQTLAIEKVGADAGRATMLDGMKSRLELYRSERAYTEQQQ